MTSIKDLKVGDKVMEPNTKYDGKAIVWKIADKNHSGYPANTVTLISDEVLLTRKFDSLSQDYSKSGIKEWLNDGFLEGFSNEFKNKIISTSVDTYTRDYIYIKSDHKNVEGKIFLASRTEVNLGNESGVEGTGFPLFTDNDSRKGKYKGFDHVWWLRTAYSSTSDGVRSVGSDGSLVWDRFNDGYGGVRPLCNLESEIFVSEKASNGVYTILWNEPPQITSSTGNNLGTKDGGFSVKYKVADPDEKGNLNVEEYLDDNKIRSFTASPGSEHSIKLNQNKYFELKNGDHELKVIVKDSTGGDAQKTFKFNKNETEILFELDKPLDADDMPTKAMISWQGKVPKEATMTIELCNNGYDENPAWEDVTEKVALNRKIFLSNKEKIADKRGLNVRVHIKRNGAEGDCYISSIGGNFE